jgi:hypothetical protein
MNRKLGLFLMAAFCSIATETSHARTCPDCPKEGSIEGVLVEEKRDNPNGSGSGEFYTLAITGGSLAEDIKKDNADHGLVRDLVTVWVHSTEEDCAFYKILRAGLRPTIRYQGKYNKACPTCPQTVRFARFGAELHTLKFLDGHYDAKDNRYKGIALDCSDVP